MRQKLIRAIVNAQKTRKGLTLYYTNDKGENIVKDYYGGRLSSLFKAITTCTNRDCRVMKPMHDIKKIQGWKAIV